MLTMVYRIFAALRRIRCAIHLSVRQSGPSLTALLLVLALYVQAIAPLSLAAAPTRATVAAQPIAPAPAPVQETVIVFGPRRFDRTRPVSKFTEQFALASDAVAPFTLQVTNGAPDGTRRVTTATVRINGLVAADASQLNLDVGALTLDAKLSAANTVEVSFLGRVGSFLTVTLTATRGTPGPAPSISNFTPQQGPPGTLVTLAGTSLRDANSNPLVSFTGGSGGFVSAAVVSATATEVKATVPNAAVTGPIKITTSGGQSLTATPFTVQPSQEFQLTAAPTTANAIQRSAATQIIALNSPQSSFSQLATLSATGLPAGVSATFAPARITSGATSTLTLNLANANLAPGAYPYTVNGAATVDGQEIRRAATATLNVIAAGQTALTGRVLSNTQQPISGATVSLDGRTATTDAAGNFLLIGVTAGNNRPVRVDGRTATAPNVTYPVIVEPANLVANQINALPFIFYLPPIDTQYEVTVVPNSAMSH